ncbi:hypothetical protein chiPu_0032657, partial [Chiloscyllium punctatum]|nr:hypothetical protein [Chiloscyllium punctatum]
LVAVVAALASDRKSSRGRVPGSTLAGGHRTARPGPDRPCDQRCRCGRLRRTSKFRASSEAGRRRRAPCCARTGRRRRGARNTEPDHGHEVEGRERTRGTWRPIACEKCPERRGRSGRPDGAAAAEPVALRSEFESRSTGSVRNPGFPFSAHFALRRASGQEEDHARSPRRTALPFVPGCVADRPRG